MESSDVEGADTARLTQASEQIGVTTRQDALPKVVKSSDQEIKEHTDEKNEVTTTHDSDGHENLDQVGNITKNMDDLDVDDEPAKKKKKMKSKSSKKRRMITGFEGMPILRWPLCTTKSNQIPEFYCDAPVTPEQAAEEKRMYASRMELCIQRYRSKRKMGNDTALLFDKYLFLGGIDSSPVQFIGADTEAMKSATNAEIRQMKARDFIPYGRGTSKFFDSSDDSGWVVDFEGIAKGFLSRWVPEKYYRIEPEVDYAQAAGLVNNFLNYILHHNVCPEYTAQIKAAQAICQIAPTELLATTKIYEDLPDTFNSAARFLFCEGGVHAVDDSGNVTISDASVKLEPAWDGEDPKYAPKKFDPQLALIAFRFHAMDAIKDVILTDALCKTDPKDIRVIATKTQAYQVTSVHRPTKKRKKHNEECLAKEGLGGKIKAAGTAKMRRTIIDHAYSNMPRPDELESELCKAPNETFIFDDDLLANLTAGMKMRLEVCELNIGMRFVKQCLEVRTSFDNFLPQSLMFGFREPVANEREAPSASKPESAHPVDGDDILEEN